MNIALRALLAAALTAAAAGAQEAVPPAPSEAVQAEMRAVQQLLARATAEFDGAEQSRSIVLLDEVVTRVEGLRR